MSLPHAVNRQDLDELMYFVYDGAWQRDVVQELIQNAETHATHGIIRVVHGMEHASCDPFPLTDTDPVLMFRSEFKPGHYHNGYDVFVSSGTPD